MSRKTFITSNVTENPFILSNAYLETVFDWMKSGKSTGFYTGEDSSLTTEFMDDVSSLFIPKAYLTAISLDDVKEIRYSEIKVEDFPSLSAQCFFLKDGRILYSDCWGDPFNIEEGCDFYSVGAE